MVGHCFMNLNHHIFVTKNAVDQVVAKACPSKLFKKIKLFKTTNYKSYGSNNYWASYMPQIRANNNVTWTSKVAEQRQKASPRPSSPKQQLSANLSIPTIKIDSSDQISSAFDTKVAKQRQKASPRTSSPKQQLSANLSIPTIKIDSSDQISSAFDTKVAKQRQKASPRPSSPIQQLSVNLSIPTIKIDSSDQIVLASESNSEIPLPKSNIIDDLLNELSKNAEYLVDSSSDDETDSEWE